MAAVSHRQPECICVSDRPFWRLGKSPTWESGAYAGCGVETLIIYTIDKREAAITAVPAMQLFAGKKPDFDGGHMSCPRLLLIHPSIYEDLHGNYVIDNCKYCRHEVGCD